MTNCIVSHCSGTFAQIPWSFLFFHSNYQCTCGPISTVVTSCHKAFTCTQTHVAGWKHVYIQIKHVCQMSMVLTTVPQPSSHDRGPSNWPPNIFDLFIKQFPSERRAHVSSVHIWYVSWCTQTKALIISVLSSRWVITSWEPWFLLSWQLKWTRESTRFPFRHKVNTKHYFRYKTKYSWMYLQLFKNFV